MTAERPIDPSRPPGVGRVSLPAGGRAAIAVLVLVADLAIFWIFARGAVSDSGAEAGMTLVVKINALVGAVLCLVLAVLNLRSWPPRAVTGRSFSALTLVTIVKLLVVATAMIVLGAFTTLSGLSLTIVVVVESLAVLWLAVGTSRHLAGAQPAPRA